MASHVATHGATHMLLILVFINYKTIAEIGI